MASLLKRGLVERFPDPEGGMARKSRPTEEGLRLLADDRACSREGVEMVVSEWPPNASSGSTPRPRLRPGFP
ncbi:hypothetical protein AB0I53_30630 [Saccharopolyspora sp. NPDC050389]|uniref:hypothetical protein n=1 Tax=Saccharopolyspora sp. NPDC050389 TaxID=3155516 RepID=UPI0033FC986E